MTELIYHIATTAVRFTGKLKKSSADQKLWLCGGARLAGSLLDVKLIDRLILKVNPVIIGNGIPLFDGNNKKDKLELEEIKSYKSGAVITNYRVLYV